MKLYVKEIFANSFIYAVSFINFNDDDGAFVIENRYFRTLSSTRYSEIQRYSLFIQGTLGAKMNLITHIRSYTEPN